MYLNENYELNSRSRKSMKGHTFFSPLAEKVRVLMLFKQAISTAAGGKTKTKTKTHTVDFILCAEDKESYHKIPK